MVGIEIEEQSKRFVLEDHRGEVPQPLEGDVKLQVLTLHIVAERAQVAFKFLKYLRDTG